MVTSSERRCHLANGIVIAKACANWTETLPSLKSRDTKTRTDIKNLLHTKVRYCSVVSESVVICQPTLKMAEEIDFENRRISNFKGLVTLDRVIGHTVVHHSLTSTYIPRLRFDVFIHRLCARYKLFLRLRLHTKFHRNQKNFLWTDGLTYISPM